MAAGWLVPARRSGNDEFPVLVMYAAAFDTRDGALAAVLAHLSVGESLQRDPVAYPLQETTVDQLRLAPGEVRLI